MRTSLPITLCALICGCTAPITLLPPTGEHAVGHTTSTLSDPSRDEVLGDGGPRAVTARVWYPADPGGEPAPYVVGLDALRPALSRQAERLFTHVEVHAVVDAPPIADPSRLPVVVLSHGDDRITPEYTFLAEDLASHGYVVLGVDHPYDARAALDAAGDPVPYAEDAWPPLPPPSDDGEPDPDSEYAGFYRDRVDVRVADARFALDTLAAAGIGPLDPERLDTDRVAFAGHSVGGVAAGSFCRDEPRAVACVNLDGESPNGPMYLDDDGAAFDPPLLMVTKPFTPTDADLAAWGLTREVWEQNRDAWLDAHFGAVGGGSWRVELDGATHESFTDEPWVLAALLGDDPAAAEAHLQTVRAWVRAFADRFVRDLPAPLLDTPADGVQRWPG